MPIVNRKEADDVLSLVRALKPAQRTGIDLSTLGVSVQIAPTRVERLLRKHTGYFVALGSTQKYALNRFEKFGGSAELIIADVERSYEQTKSQNLSSLLMTIAATAMVVSIITMIANQ